MKEGFVNWGFEPQIKEDKKFYIIYGYTTQGDWPPVGCGILGKYDTLYEAFLGIMAHFSDTFNYDNEPNFNYGRHIDIDTNNIVPLTTEMLTQILRGELDFVNNEELKLTINQFGDSLKDSDVGRYYQRTYLSAFESDEWNENPSMLSIHYL